MAFPSGSSPDMPSIVLNGDKLPWVERVVHISNTLPYSGTMEQDTREKHAIFIDRCMELNQEFHMYPTSEDVSNIQQPFYWKCTVGFYI